MKKIILVGSSHFVNKWVNEFTDKIDNLDLKSVNGDTFNVEEISDYLFSIPIFGEERVLIVKDADKIKDLRDNCDIFLSECEAHIIFISDETKSFLKTFEKGFEIIKEGKKNYRDYLVQVVKIFEEKGVKIDLNEAKEVYELCMRNMEIVENEAEKISLYFYSVRPDSFNEILNLISFTETNTLFMFIDAFYLRMRNDAIKFYNRLVEKHENFQMVFYSLSKRAVEILNYKISQDLVTGHTYKVSQIKKGAKMWSRQEIGELIACFYDIDKRLKVSRVDLADEIFSLILKI